MRYKCTDCGQEYDIKPEFCDCGNNVFTEIAGENASSAKSRKKPEPAPVVQKEVKSLNYSDFIDIPSLLFFILCLILSVLSLIFIGRDSKPAENVVKENTAVVKNVPSIDKLWKEKTPETVKTPAPEPVAVKVVENKVVKKQETPKKVAQQVSKPQQNSQAKPAVQSQAQPTMTEKEKQEIIQKLSTRKTPPQKTEPAKTETQKVTEQPRQEKTEVKAEVKAPDTAQLKKEFEAYKVELRNRIGKDINFGAVIGDGNCAVTFKIDAAGNLVNRKFAQQSKNNSLNDAVYAAVMGNPAFKVPPAGYSGEVLTLTVTMYDGKFEVKLK